MFSPCSTRCGQVPPRLVIGRPGAATKPALTGHVPTPSLRAIGIATPVCRSANRDLHQRQGFSGHANCLACASDCSARPGGLYRRARTPGAARNRGNAGRAAAAHSRGSSWFNSNGGDPLDNRTHQPIPAIGAAGRGTHVVSRPVCFRSFGSGPSRPPCATPHERRMAAFQCCRGFCRFAAQRRNRRRWLACSDIRMVLPFAMMCSAVSLSGWRRLASPCHCEERSDEAPRAM
jgi:hypothetical protein